MGWPQFLVRDNLRQELGDTVRGRSGNNICYEEMVIMEEADAFLMPALGLIGCVLVVLCNVIHLHVKTVLRRRCEGVQFWAGYRNDRVALRRLVEEETDPIERKKLMRVVSRLNAIPYLMGTGMMAFVILAIIRESAEGRR